MEFSEALETYQERNGLTVTRVNYPNGTAEEFASHSLPSSICRATEALAKWQATNAAASAEAQTTEGTESWNLQ